MTSCAAGHDTGRRTRGCPACRRQAVIEVAAAADPSLPAAVVAAAVDAVAPGGQAMARLATAMADGPGVLAAGAPPMAGRLAAELIARGSAVLVLPACTMCGRTGKPLFRGDSGATCQRCRAWQTAAPCARCGKRKPVAVRDEASRPVCEVCRRHERGQRECGRCGKTASIAVRARDGQPDICVNCYQMPAAVCSVCGRLRECNFAATGRPVCPSCSPRAVAACARCGRIRPPAARWPEGPVCDTCYAVALRSRGQCARCGQQRRLVDPPGPAATTCADCAGLAPMSLCTRCGTEDKLYEKGLCARCSLRRRTIALLSAGTGDVPETMTAVLQAICSARNPRTALNWLRSGAGAAILADTAAGRVPLTHEALDEHPRPRAAGFLRQVLVAGGVLPLRDEELARTGHWLEELLQATTDPVHRRLIRAFATWHVMRRLRRAAQARQRPRTPTARARKTISTSARFLTWLAGRGTTLNSCRQADIDDWMLTSPGAAEAGHFLTWAARCGHCPAFTIPQRRRGTGTAITDSQRWDLVTWLLHDDTLPAADRIAGSLVLLFGLTMTRIAAMTTSDVTRHCGIVHIKPGRHEIPVPGTLGTLLTTFIADGKPYTGTGSPAASLWLFPGLLPGQPITPQRLAARLRDLGIPVMAARRTALTGLAAQLPAAVLADILGISPVTAVKWSRDAGADWNRYAAELARSRNHEQRNHEQGE